MNIEQLAAICDANPDLPTCLGRFPLDTPTTITIGALLRLANAVEFHALEAVRTEMQDYVDFDPPRTAPHLVKAFADALRKPARGYQFAANTVELCLYSPTTGKVTARIGVEWEDMDGREEIVLTGGAALFGHFSDFIEWVAANPAAAIGEVVAQLEALGIHNR